MGERSTGNYLLFGYEDFYPGGAASDYLGRFKSMNAALIRATTRPTCDHHDLYDIEGDRWFELRGGHWMEVAKDA